MLRVDNLAVRRNGVLVLQGLDFDVGSGEILGIRGPNGSGKSSLLQAIMGLIKPAQGRLLFRDEDITGLSAWIRAQRGIFMISQRVEIAELLNTLDHIRVCRYLLNDLCFWNALFGNRRSERRILERLATTLTSVLGPDAHRRRAGYISGGQRKLLGTLMAGERKPELVLMDEPFAGLSPTASEWVSEKVRQFSAAGASIVLVEHRSELERLSHRTVLLERGKLTEVYTT